MIPKTPGVYVQEISLLPASVAQVATAVPVFIGYTEFARDANGDSLLQKPKRISSLLEYRRFFGQAPVQRLTAQLDEDGKVVRVAPSYHFGTDNAARHQDHYKMDYALQAFFANGGGPCYIFSVATGYPTAGQSTQEGLYNNPASTTAALQVLKQVDEITLLVFPDLDLLTSDRFYNVCRAALSHCRDLQDRFAILDVKTEGLPGGETPEGYFRNQTGTDALSYGAAYHPFLRSTLNYRYAAGQLSLHHRDAGDNPLDFDGFNYQAILDFMDAEEASRAPGATPAEEAAAEAAYKVLAGIDEADPLAPEDDPDATYTALAGVFTNAWATELKAALGEARVTLSPSPYVAGAYARVDATRGVWKAPANVSLTGVLEPVTKFSDPDQADFNVHPTGKSINLIRQFVGKGQLIWGARTLAGNDNEWRYVSVRRFFIMVEESVKKATEQYVFEPNDANTWVKVRSMIENFLLLQWRAGALMGATPDEAFFVKVGLGQTMTEQDVLEGRLIVEIGMAAVRPAEFILLRFSHKMQQG
jgi:phage tail sheath protein FI